jgi:putative acetyltransferase
MRTSREVVIRKIEAGDNLQVATIIRTVLEEFEANVKGTAYYDTSTDSMFELFEGTPRSVYHVALLDGKVVGGSGVFPSPGLPEDTCELVRMYILPEARSYGVGSLLITQCLLSAKELGFDYLYLETMPNFKKAVTLYEKFGFAYLEGPLGETGHYACSIWMRKALGT